jgi:Crinkler effector protein N-terminal domain
VRYFFCNRFLPHRRTNVWLFELDKKMSLYPTRVWRGSVLKGKLNFPKGFFSDTRHAPKNNKPTDPFCFQSPQPPLDQTTKPSEIMSLPDIYTILCILVGEKAPFPIKIAKSGTVNDIKELIKKENPDTLGSIDDRFLDLYHTEFANDDELIANVKAQPLDSPLLATTPLTDIFPCTPKKETVHLLVKPSEWHW